MYQHNCELDNAEESITEITEILWERKRPAWFNYLMNTTGKKRKMDSNEHHNEEPSEKKQRKIIKKVKFNVGAKRTYRVISKKRLANCSFILFILYSL